MRIKDQEYTRRARRASQLTDRGDYDGVIAILEELVSSDISDVDKAVMCLNIAIVYDKMGHVEEAPDWGD